MRLHLAIVILLSLYGIAIAQMLHGVSDSLSGGGSVAPPTCTNKLDFTQACNSQYMGMF